MSLHRFSFFVAILGLAFSVVFSGCVEREVLDRDLVEYDSQVVDSKDQVLSIYTNTVSITANYPPDGGPEFTTISITTTADPEGLLLVLTPEFTESTPSFRVTLREEIVAASVQIASETRPEFNQIKIAPEGDELTINVDDGAYVKTYPIPVRFYPTVEFSPLFLEAEANEATLKIYDLTLGPDAQPQAHLYSGIDPVGFPVVGAYIDPDLESPPTPFPAFQADFFFNMHGWSYPDARNLALREGDAFYVRYRDRVFMITAFDTMGEPMEESR